MNYVSAEVGDVVIRDEGRETGDRKGGETWGRRRDECP